MELSLAEFTPACLNPSLILENQSLTHVKERGVIKPTLAGKITIRISVKELLFSHRLYEYGY